MAGRLFMHSIPLQTGTNQRETLKGREHTMLVLMLMLMLVLMLMLLVHGIDSAQPTCRPDSCGVQHIS